MRSDSSIADFHRTLQIVMGWTDFHLHQFIIRGREYGMPRHFGPLFQDDPWKVKLGDFRFRRFERFGYEYDFRDNWQLEIRLEEILPLNDRQTYPYCSAGARATPEEDCGGPWAYMELLNHHLLTPPLEELWLIAQAVNRVLNTKEDERVREVIGDMDEFQEAVDRLEAYQSFQPEHFDRKAVNSQLKRYAGECEQRRHKETEGPLK